MSKETLLKKAKKIKTKQYILRKYTDEDLELVLAWLNREISTKQVCGALNLKNHGGNGLYYMATIIKQGVSAKKLIVKRK